MSRVRTPVLHGFLLPDDQEYDTTDLRPDGREAL